MNLHIPAPPCVAPGAPSPRLATGNTLRWGIVSTGGIVTSVLPDLASLHDAEIVAVSSRSQDKADAFAAEHGIARAYGDAGQPGYERMFADPEVEIIYIGTPHGQHFEVAAAALKAGKHVVCEKSLTINAAEARQLVALASEHRLFLMEAIWSRFLPAVHRGFEIINSGEIGEPSWLHADLGFTAPYDRTWRLWDPVAGGGALLDLGVYPFTWALGIMGFPQSLTVSGHLNADGVDSQDSLTLSYPGSKHAQLMLSLTGSGPRQATVVGTGGWLRTGAPLHNPSRLEVHPQGGAYREESFEPIGKNYVWQFREATRCVQEGLLQSPTIPWEHSVATMALFDGARAQLGLTYRNDAMR
ncbi:Gfo/Idh/MocA family protein [Paeniglutamicibacter cryotolerans]|uniref:Putative dehydrogenase n=1 Tax=Paeniglutamicibacter cryotolerans TaxID=670079 RepID=A0A839QJ68_9MICC|nr:Gfo/Idh/MocA family oxidoreductase [Paeniglutamicibacter cryotolerans]MBB2995847.1 putative dehydrogenase [Paeniglutamicibacter cryotolerans]